MYDTPPVSVSFLAGIQLVASVRVLWTRKLEVFSSVAFLLRCKLVQQTISKNVSLAFGINLCIFFAIFPKYGKSRSKTDLFKKSEANDICIIPQAWRKTVKGRVMSNVSMTLYWWIQQHFPYELVKNEDEWDAIGGDVYERPE